MNILSNIFNNSFQNFCLLITFLSVFIIIDSVEAQTNEAEFIKLNIELSQNTIADIFQDSTGFMWFGTLNGLNKYDGIQNTIFENIPGDSSSISENTINKIIEGNEGEIWIATNEGINVLNKDDYKFNRITQENSNNTLGSNIVSDVFKDSYNQIWAVAEYPIKYIKEEKRFIAYHLNYAEPSTEPTFLFQDKRNRIWFFHHKEIFLYNEIEDTFKLAFDGAENNFNQNAYYIDIVEYKDDTWYVSVNYNGILPIKVINDVPHIDYSNEILRNRELQSLQRIHDLHIDKNKNLWIGSENSGLFSYSLINKELKNYTFDPTNDKSIISNSIWSIFEDKNGRLWFGTYSNGVCLIDKNHSKFTHYKSSFSDRGPSYNNITDFEEDNKGNVWIGTDGGGLNYLNREANRFTYFKHNPLDKNSLSADAVLSLCFADEYNLWIGTWEGGISILNTKSGKFKTLNTNNSRLSSNRIFDIAKDGKGKIYIASFGEGVDVYDQLTGSFKNYKFNPSNSNSLSNNNTTQILVDSSNNVWICTQFGGLNKMTLNANDSVIFDRFMHNPNNPKSISSNTIQYVFIGNNTLWAATPTGLCVLDNDSKTFTELTKRDGLPTNSIQTIIDDENGDLWLGTLKGLSHFKLRDSIFVNYTIQDGLQGDKFGRNSVNRLRSGELIFGGPNGFNIFQPEEIKKNQQKPAIVLTDLKIFNKSVLIGNDSPLRKHIERTNEITLTHKQSVFTLEFVAISYTHPDKNQYAFYLEGLEEEWNYVGKQQMATYTNLDPGKYSFHVKASNNDGIWNEEGITLIINIVPPFWKTWWFRILSFMLTISLIVIYYSLRLQAVKTANEKLEQKVKERTIELKEKNNLLLEQSESLNETNAILEERQQFIEEQSEELLAQRDELSEVNAVKDKLFSVIAHDLKNPFSPLIGMTELLLHQYDLYDDNKRMKMVRVINESASKIYELLTSLFNWSRSQRGDIKPNFEEANIIEVLLSNIELAKAQSTEKEIEIINRIDDKEIIASIDRNLINTVVRNLLNNAIKFTSLRGEIIVSCIKEASKVLISIKDNGVGISEENLKKIFNSSTLLTTTGTNNEAGTGLGLAICKDFIRLHNGEIWVTSKEGEGSEFCFTIPLDRNRS